MVISMIAVESVAQANKTKRIANNFGQTVNGLFIQYP